jgi:hypothetical protein
MDEHVAVETLRDQREGLIMIERTSIRTGGALVGPYLI